MAGGADVEIDLQAALDLGPVKRSEHAVERPVLGLDVGRIPGRQGGSRPERAKRDAQTNADGEMSA